MLSHRKCVWLLGLRSRLMKARARRLWVHWPLGTMKQKLWLTPIYSSQHRLPYPLTKTCVPYQHAVQGIRMSNGRQQAERLCAWYRSDDCGRKPSENEIVSHMILPLFLGLGWSHQQIAVEWNNVDMAFFKTTPTTEENCVMIVEAKGLGQALSKVLEQPQRYVARRGLRNVRYIVTTDGANIFVYS